MPSAIPDQIQSQLITDLLIESFEGLDRFDQELLALEKGTRDQETLNIIFRVIHTIKGTAGCLGLGQIESIAHVGEGLLSLLRDDKIETSAELISALLALSDALRGILRHLEAHGSEGTADHATLLTRLQALQEPACSAARDDAAPDLPAEGFGFFHDVPLVRQTESPKPVIVAATPEPDPALAGRSSVSDSAIRVEVSQLDNLMNLVGELVLARNQIIQTVTRPDPAALLAASQRLNTLTTELQGSVMKTRMQPIGNIWTKFPRIVRDLAQELGKKVVLVMEGQSTELDRTIIEAIKDPLTHIVRNAIDHGLESPAARFAAGKPEEGRLVLRAFHEGGQVNIEFTDDGQGIDLARVKAKALERALITPDQAAALSEREISHLIFLPGFSTAEKVTNISGRGVGMDVVKTNIEKIGGSVDVQSAAGRGTTLKIKIPLTLAIVPALIVMTGGERFAIPQVSLLELVRLEGNQTQAGIEILFDAPVYRLRGQLLPLVYLHRELKLRAPASSAATNIVVLKADGHTFGLVVDRILDTQEIVVKPLGQHLKGLLIFAGATIMGDGRIALILDALGLAQKARVITEREKRRLQEKAAATVEDRNRQTLLLFRLGTMNRLAMPLSSVGRLEKFPARLVEREGDREVVQYRGQIMPLIRLGSILGHATEAADDAELSVVVHSRQGHSIGVVVGRIEDIIEESVVLQNRARRPGTLGSAVIQGKVTELVDVEQVVDAAN